MPTEIPPRAQAIVDQYRAAATRAANAGAPAWAIELAALRAHAASLAHAIGHLIADNTDDGRSAHEIMLELEVEAAEAAVKHLDNLTTLLGQQAKGKSS